MPDKTEIIEDAAMGEFVAKMEKESEKIIEEITEEANNASAERPGDGFDLCLLMSMASRLAINEVRLKAIERWITVSIQKKEAEKAAADTKGAPDA